MADLRRERAGIVDHGSLECPVMRKRTTGLTLIAGGRGDVDDRAAFRLTHVRHCGAAAISHGAVIGGEDLLDVGVTRRRAPAARSEEHTSELQSLMRISYAVFCLKKKQHTQ